MIDQGRTESKLPPETVAALLHAALRVQKNGNRVGARALLHALAAQQPDEPRVWLALATVAETNAEQRQALERVIALDPQHPLARRAAEYLGRRGPVVTPAPVIVPSTPTTPDVPAAPDVAVQEAVTPAPVIAPSTPATPEVPAAPDGPVQEAEEVTAVVAPNEEAGFAPAPLLTPTVQENPAREIRWPIFLVIALAIIPVLAVAILVRPAETNTPETAATPTLPGMVARSPAPIGTRPAGAGPVGVVPSTAAQATQRPAPATNLPTRTPVTPSATPQPTAPPVLAPGQVVEQGQWHASLLRPEHALALEGSIATLQPRGYFVLALVAVGNDGAAPARIPPDLFALVDRQGRRYAPLPAASTAYLGAYGRGEHGDLSMEELIPSGGGIVSIPLIFDIPPGAGALTLHVGSARLGWPINPTAVPGTPTPTL